MGSFSIGLPPLAFDFPNFLCTPTKPAREPKKAEAITPVFPDPEITTDGKVNLFNKKNTVYTGEYFDAFYIPVAHSGLENGRSLGKQILKIQKDFPNRKVLVLMDSVIGLPQFGLSMLFMQSIPKRLANNQDNFVYLTEYDHFKSYAMKTALELENKSEALNSTSDHPFDLFGQGIAQELNNSNIRIFLELAPPESFFSGIFSDAATQLTFLQFNQGQNSNLEFMKKNFTHYNNSMGQRNAQALNRAYRLSKMHDNAIVVIVMGGSHAIKSLDTNKVNFLDKNTSIPKAKNEYALFFFRHLFAEFASKSTSSDPIQLATAMMDLANRIERHHVLSLSQQFKQFPTRKSEIFDTWLKKEVDPKQESTFWKAMAH